MSIEPGKYGYRKAKWQHRLMITLALCASIIAILAMREMMTDPGIKTLMTISSILLVLPMGNIASPLFASTRYKTPPKSFYEKFHPYEEKTIILYDLILTTEEQVIPLDAIVVHPVCIVGYCPVYRFDTARAERGINELLRNAKIDRKIKILNDESALEHRLQVLKPASEYEDDGTVDYAVRTLKSLSM